jgi:hypothetical protein
MASQRNISNGYWKITKLGIDFMEGKVSVPKFLYIYLGSVEKESNEKILFNQINKKRFSLSQTEIKGEEKENG